MPSLADGTGLPKPVFLHLKRRYLPSCERCLRVQGMDEARELRKGVAQSGQVLSGDSRRYECSLRYAKATKLDLEGRIIHCKRDKYQPADPELNCLWNFTACLWIG